MDFFENWSVSDLNNLVSKFLRQFRHEAFSLDVLSLDSASIDYLVLNPSLYVLRNGMLSAVKLEHIKLLLYNGIFSIK